MNPIRKEMLAEAMKQAGEPFTIARLEPYVPSDFGLIQADLDELAPAIDAEFVTVESADSAQAAPAADTVAPPPRVLVGRPDPRTAARLAAAAAAPVEIAEALVFRLVGELAELRAALSSAGGTLQEKTQQRHRAVVQFARRLKPMSQSELLRQNAKDQLAQRRAIADGTMAPEAPTVVPGDSLIDRIAASHYAAGSRGAEGGGNFRRVVCDGQPIYPASKRGAYVAPK